MTAMLVRVGATTVLLLVVGCGPAATDGGAAAPLTPPSQGRQHPLGAGAAADEGTQTGGPRGQAGPAAPEVRTLPTAPPHAGTSSDGAASQPHDPSRTGGTMHELAADVERLAQRHEDSYAGLEVDGNRVRVYRVPDGTFDAALRGLDGGDRLLLSDAEHSRAELQRVQQRVEADAEHWRRTGLRFSTLAIRHDGAAVEVGVAEPDRVRDAQRALEQRYGDAAPVRVVQAGPVVPLGPAE